MTLQLKVAKRSDVAFKMAVSAPSGGGKTLGALLIAYGMLKEKYPENTDDQIWEKIVVIDTENGSGSLYSGTKHHNIKIGDYLVIELNKPYTTERYIQALELAEENGLEFCIIDSITHSWAGQGGLLEQQQKIAKRIGNSYTAWREITPKYDAFIARMLESPMHIIATMRAKQEYLVNNEEGNKRFNVKKVGLAPIQRDGTEYEFTAFFEINVDHEAFGSKDRTSIYDQELFVITPEVGRKYMKWLLEVDDTPEEVIGEIKEAEKVKTLTELKEEVIDLLKAKGGSSNEVVVNLVKEYAPNGNPNSISSADELSELISRLNDID
jgi:hypothetical protein